MFGCKAEVSEIPDHLLQKPSMFDVYQPEFSSFAGHEATAA